MSAEHKWEFPDKWYFICFKAATAFCALTGLLILLHDTRDFTRYFLIRSHVGIGYANLVFATLSLRAFIKESGIFPKPRAYFLPTVLIQLLPISLHLPFKFTWFVGLSAWGLLSRRYYRFPTLLFTLIFNSGLYLSIAGYAGTLRSDLFYWIHVASAAVLVLWLPFAMAAVGKHRCEAAKYKVAVTACAVLFLFILPCVYVLLRARTNNARFLYPPAELSEGYAFQIKPDGPLRRPRVDPTPYIQSSKSCGGEGCHPDIHSQWQVSSHRMAASTLPYRKILGEFADRFGWEATAFCSRCHNPLTVVYGIPDRPGDALADRLRAEGISCQYCHAISRADPVAGNGNARGRFMPLFPSPLKQHMPGDRDIQRRFIIWDLYQHRRDYRKSALNRGEWCGPCHRVDVPRRFTDGHTLILGDTYTPWKENERDIGLSCTDCHMPLTTYSSPVHARPDHRILGINQAMDRLLPSGSAPDHLVKEFNKATEDWLQGKLPVPMYEVLYLKFTLHKKYAAFREFFNRPATLNVSLDAEMDASTNVIKAAVKLTNTTKAHRVPASPLDLAETWVELTATDSGGKEFFRNCPPEGPDRASGDCIVLGGTVINESGDPVQKHYFWDARGVRDKAIIEPGGSLLFDRAIPVPAHVKLPVTLSARCLYRRYNQNINTWVYGPQARPFPTTELSRTTSHLR